MKGFRVIFMIVPALLALLAGRVYAGEDKVKEERVVYAAGGMEFLGFVAYNTGLKGTRPVVLVVHEWWGLNDYARMRAKMLAELGYLAVAIDMYGGGQTAADPAGAQALAGPFYKNSELLKTNLAAGLQMAREHPLADTSRVAAIGYCFGGYVVLNGAKLGLDLDGVVSFHGGLLGAPVDKNLLKARILVCHGGSDDFVPEEQVDNFRREMDKAGAKYQFKTYPGATHAFTNPDATEAGKKFNLPIAYNEAADQASWDDMKLFLENLFMKK